MLLSLSLAVLPWDIPLARLFDADHLAGDVRRFFELTEFFAHGFGITLILIAVLVLAPDRRRRLVRVVMGLLASALVVHGIKLVVLRMRPGFFWSQGELDQTTWLGFASWIDPTNAAILNVAHASQSFPSGHSAAVSALAVGLIWLLGKGRGLFTAMVILGCLQRVLFHAHWPSDVLVGAAIGTGVALWICYSPTSNRLLVRWEQKRLNVSNAKSPTTGSTNEPV